MKAAIARRRQLYRGWVRSGEKKALADYHAQRGLVRAIVRKKQRESWKQLTRATSMDFDKNAGMFHARLPQLRGVSRGAKILSAAKTANGDQVYDEAGKQEAFAAFYEKLGVPVTESPPLDAPVEILGQTVTTRYDDAFRVEVEHAVEAHTRLNERGTYHKGGVEAQNLNTRIKGSNPLNFAHHLLRQMSHDDEDLLYFDLFGQKLNILFQNALPIDSKQWLGNKCSSGIGSSAFTGRSNYTCIYLFQDGC